MFHLVRVWGIGRLTVVVDLLVGLIIVLVIRRKFESRGFLLSRAFRDDLRVGL